MANSEGDAKLFDLGYVTVTLVGVFEVSPRIKSECENGRHYYAFYGRAIYQPEQPTVPAENYIRV